MGSVSSTQGSEITRNNEQIVKQLEEGDLIKFDRGTFSHWGVYVGDGYVVHLASVDDGTDTIKSQHLLSSSGIIFKKATVLRENFWKIAHNQMASIEKKDSPFSPSKIVERAISLIGAVGYNVLRMNCDHFARWCRYGKVTSEQIESGRIALSIMDLILFL